MTLEADDSSENRLAKIQAIIEECQFGIHDISRTEVDGDPPLPRFNMPLELGLFLRAKRYGNKDRNPSGLLSSIEGRIGTSGSSRTSRERTFTRTALILANALSRLRHGCAPKAAIPRSLVDARSPKGLRCSSLSWTPSAKRGVLSPRS
jgi:hypothetical protein